MPTLCWTPLQRNPEPSEFKQKHRDTPLLSNRPPPWINLKKQKLGFSESIHKREADESSKDRVSLLNRIKSCGREKNLCELRRIHDDIFHGNNSVFFKDVYVSTSLITTFAKCGALKESRDVFEQLLIRDVVSWTALISGYAQHGYGQEALVCFNKMKEEGISPNSVTYLSILRACGSIGCLEIGERIDVEVRKRGLLEKDVLLGNTLIRMYARCGALEKAQEVFEKIPVRNVVSWTALISGYTEHGLGHKAVKCYTQMQDEGIFPDVVTYICILKACGIIGSLKLGEDIDARVRKEGLLQKDVVIGNALIDMYAKCGALDKARGIFNELPVDHIAAWNALITGYAKCGLGHEALKCFRVMKDKKICPNVVTYVSILKACGMIGSLEIGEEIYGEVWKRGLLHENLKLGTALVDMYAKCGSLEKAREVFGGLTSRDTASWTSLLAGYSHNGHHDEAIKCFKDMQCEGICPDSVTYLCILKACGNAGSLEIGESIGSDLRRQGLLEKNVALGNALLEMYAKCGALEKAQELFEWLPMRDALSWTSLIAGYTNLGLGDEALKCFRHMQNEGVLPDAVTYACVLKACGIVGSLNIGEEIGDEVKSQGLLHTEIVIGTALIDMYAKCGELPKARGVFEELPVQNVISWVALMSGYAQIGQANMVLELYTKMRREGLDPNLVTFLVLINACSHGGLLEVGQKLFDEMQSIYGLVPTLDHYTCMIDLFGRAGHFDKAMKLLDEVQSLNHLELLLAILGASCKWMNVNLGRWAFKESIKLDEKCATAYITMQNIYMATNMEREADVIKCLKAKNKARTVSAHSCWIDARRNVHSFDVLDDQNHSPIYAKLGEIHRKRLQKDESRHLHWLPQMVVDENMVCGHNDKLSIAYALIHTHEDRPIHVTKDMRICDKCHSTILLLSMIEKRRILVNAANHIHIFEDGKCICDDNY